MYIQKYKNAVCRLTRIGNNRIGNKIYKCTIDVYEIKYLLIKKENVLYGTTKCLCVSTIPSSFLCKNS